MSDIITFSNQEPEVETILGQHQVNEQSLREFKEKIKQIIKETPDVPVPEQLIGMSLDEVEQYFEDLLKELGVLSSLNLLSAIEAKLRLDFWTKVYNSNTDKLTQDFKDLASKAGNKVRMEDILDIWRKNHPSLMHVIRGYKGAIHYRDWVAHGRYWVHKSISRKYDFSVVYSICDGIIKIVPFSV